MFSNDYHLLIITNYDQNTSKKNLTLLIFKGRKVIKVLVKLLKHVKGYTKIMNVDKTKTINNNCASLLKRTKN